MGGEVALGRWMVVPEVGEESKKHSSSDSQRKGLHLTDFKRGQETRIDQRCKGRSSPYFLSLIFLLSMCALVVLSVVQKSSWRSDLIEPGNKTIRNNHKDCTSKSDKRGKG